MIRPRSRRRRSVRYTIFVLALSIVSPASVFAFQWPVEEKVLTATFGESRWDHFHTGIDIGGGEQQVRPVDAGEVIFSNDTARRSGGLAYGLGAFVVLEHAQGIRSLYAHLDPTHSAEIPDTVTTDTVLGVIGESGASLGKHLHLEIIDIELGSYVNPLVVLPSIPDSITPEIKQLTIVSDESGSDPQILHRGQTVRSGDYRLLIELYDQSEHVAYFCPMAPYQITGYFNGSEVFHLKFDTLFDSTGALKLGRDDDAPAYEDLYIDTWTIDIGTVPFRVGEIQIEIVASDVIGNESSYRLAVSAK